MKDIKNYGKLLEDILYYNLQNTPYIKIYNEIQLTKLYGWNATSVDFMIEFNNIIIFIQTKYLNSRRKETRNIHKFLNSTYYIYNQLSTNKPFIGIWVCRLHPFPDNEIFLSNNQSYVVSSFNSIYNLVDNTINQIKKFVI